MQTEILHNIDFDNICWNFDNNKKELIHNIHPYPAKFIPEIPRNLITRLGLKKNTVVFDPFCGSGTTLKVAQDLGLESIGVDLNPIACLISSIKTSPLPSNFETVYLKIVDDLIKKNKPTPELNIPNLDHWFSQVAISFLYNARLLISKYSEQSLLDHLNFCLSSIIVRISNQESDTRYAAKENLISFTDCCDLFSKACNKLLEAKASLTFDKSSKIINKDILQVSKKDIGLGVDLVITSPPYPNAYEYWLYHKYRMFWLNHDPLAVKEYEIGARAHFFKKNHHTKDDFAKQLNGVFKLLESVCNKNAYCCFVVGRSIIHGEVIENDELVVSAGLKNSFKYISTINREISGTKKSFNPSYGKIKKEQIVILQKI